MRTQPSLLLALACALAFAAPAECRVTIKPGTRVTAPPETVTVRSGELALRAVVYRPMGRGPFPGILFLHGSGHGAGVAANGQRDQRHPELTGPLFARHGYVFLYLYRRGDALSKGQGTAGGDVMDQEEKTAGTDGRNGAQLSLLEGDEMNDALAGLRHLRRLKGVNPRRIGVVGISFGGSLAVLAAERAPSIRAGVVFSPAGYSWDRSPTLRARLIAASRRVPIPLFFIHATNDFTVESGKALAAARARRGRPGRVKVYPAVGKTQEEGHDFIDLGVSVWERDVFAFLDRYVKRG